MELCGSIYSRKYIGIIFLLYEKVRPKNQHVTDYIILLECS